jgi:hypothetical protein
MIPQTWLNVLVVHPPKLAKKFKASKKQIIIDKARKAVMTFLDTFAKNRSVTSPQRTDILAVDLKVSVLSRIAECEDIQSDEVFKRQVLDHYPLLKDHLTTLRSQILDAKRTICSSTGWLFLYSYIEDHWVLKAL